MDSNFIGDKIDLVEIDEEEVDWINPNLKSITAFPDEHVNSILAPERSDIILRKPNSDLFLIYISDKLFLFNSSNLHYITQDKPKGIESKLSTNSLCTINFGKEIKRITINVHEPDYFCIIFKDSIQAYAFNELIRYIGNPPCIKAILKPSLSYDIPNTQTEAIHQAYVFDSIESKILLALKNEITLVSSKNQIIASHKYKSDITDLIILEGGTILTSSEDALYLQSYNQGSKTFLAIKKLNIKSILNDEEENDYKITYLARFKNFLGVSLLQKQQDSDWKDFPQISQHFLFLDFSISDKNFILKTIHKSEWVFNYNDDYGFKSEPRYQSVFYEEYNLFILTSNQYHQAEIFYLEEDIEDMKIVRGSFEDDKRIFVPKNKKIEKMSLCQGINIIDFKHEDYSNQKLNLKSEEIFTPPLVILCNDVGNLVVYYLPNLRDFKCVLKEKFGNPQNILNRFYDSKQEEMVKSDVKGNLFGNLNIVPPNKISFPDDLKDSPNIFKKNDKKEISNANVLADCFKMRKEIIETQTFTKLEKNVINVKDEAIKKEDNKFPINNLNPPVVTLKKEEIIKTNITKIEQNLNLKKEEKVVYKDANTKLIEKNFIVENDAEQLKNNLEQLRNLKFEKFYTNLKRQLDLYKEVVSYHSTDMMELLKSLDKNSQREKSENDLMKFIQLSEKVCKEFFDPQSMIQEFKKYNDKIYHLINRKDLIDKIAQNADKINPNLLNIDSFLLSYHRDREENSKSGSNIDLSQMKNEMSYRLPILYKEIDQLKIFLKEFKQFQSEFDDMGSINKKIKNKNKYDGIFKKFKSVSTEIQEENLKSNIVSSKISNLPNYSVESQSSLYETIMKKYEEIFINLDHRFSGKLKPKLEKVLYEFKRLKQSENKKNSKEGFSVSNLDISYTYTKIKEDSSYLGTNPVDNIFFYRELVGKFSNIFHNNNPKVTQVKTHSKSKKNLDLFFMKEEENSGHKLAKESEEKLPSDQVSLQSQNYLQKVLDKVKKKKEERDKLKLDLDFKIEEFSKIEKERMSSVNNFRETKTIPSAMPNLFSKNENEKEKSSLLISTEGKKNPVGMYEKEKAKEEKEEPKSELNVFSGKNMNLFKQEPKDKVIEEKSSKGNLKIPTEKEKLNNVSEKAKVEEKTKENEKDSSIFKTPKDTQFNSDKNMDQSNITTKTSNPLFGDSGKFSGAAENKSSFPVSNSNTKFNFLSKNNDSELKNSNTEKPTEKVAESKPTQNIFGTKDEKKENIITKLDKKEESKPTELPKGESNPKIEQMFGSQLNFFKPSDNKPSPDIKATGTANTTSSIPSNNINNSLIPSKQTEEKTLLPNTPEKIKISSSTNPPQTGTNVNNFKNISLSNNLFSNKTPILTTALPSNTNNPNNASNLQQNSIVQNSQSLDFMNKPGFGAKSNLGMTNPLSNFSNLVPGSTTSNNPAFTVNNNTSSFSQFSKNTGLSSFTGGNQNPQSNFLNQSQIPTNNNGFGDNFNNNHNNIQQTSGLAGFPANNNNNFLNNQANQQTSGFNNNFQKSNNSGFIGNNNSINSFGSMQNNPGMINQNGNLTFNQQATGGNNFANPNSNVGRNKNKPDYDLF